MNETNKRVLIVDDNKELCGLLSDNLTGEDLVVQQAHQILPEAKINRGELLWQGGQLRFMAPDALLIEKPHADLLLVALAVPSYWACIPT